MVMGEKIEGETNTLVVGAGLAGLVVAYRLQQGGIAVDVAEMRDRPGGRIHSVPNALGSGLTAELGGEAFDSDNVTCLALARELGLPLVDLAAQVTDLNALTFWLNERALDTRALQAELTEQLLANRSDWQAVQQFMKTGDISDHVKNLDNQPLTEYLANWGASAELQQAIALGYGIRYGVEADRQSSLNFLSFFRCEADCQSFFGVSDERFYLQGGNQQLTDALYAQVTERVTFGTTLVAIAETGDRRYRVTLDKNGKVTERTYGRVVLTVPFSVLRHLDLRVDMPSPQRQAIAQLAYNTPTKLITAYRGKPWQPSIPTGLVFTDLPFQHCWEASDSLQSTHHALLVMFPGGETGRALSPPQNDPNLPARLLDSLSQIFPRVASHRLNREILWSSWLQDPASLGAYAYYSPGQWIQFFGWEGRRVGNLFFAGEHCSRQFQGYMEGAAETAEQVALAILQDEGHGLGSRKR